MQVEFPSHGGPEASLVREQMQWQKNHGDTEGKSFLGRGNSKCRCSESWRKSQEVRVAEWRWAERG